MFHNTDCTFTVYLELIFVCVAQKCNKLHARLSENRSIAGTTAVGGSDQSRGHVATLHGPWPTYARCKCIGPTRWPRSTQRSMAQVLTATLLSLCLFLVDELKSGGFNIRVHQRSRGATVERISFIRSRHPTVLKHLATWAADRRHFHDGVFAGAGHAGETEGICC